MKIENVKIVDARDGYPFLRMTVDGHRAEVIEPKLTLLAKGVVVLIDEENYWYDRLSVTLPADPPASGAMPTTLHGATQDAEVVALVWRFVAEGVI